MLGVQWTRAFRLRLVFLRRATLDDEQREKLCPGLAAEARHIRTKKEITHRRGRVSPFFLLTFVNNYFNARLHCHCSSTCHCKTAEHCPYVKLRKRRSQKLESAMFL